MRMMSNQSSTLVETVSIDYEDFNESFLTCGTCLCTYDASEHSPKLLPCSHTICIQCLNRIIATFARDSGQFRCPICRELISIPRGGVAALPPSFLVNQLLDLMAKQRREVVPKCSNHPNTELLFCETCDKVFCNLCSEGNHEELDSPGIEGPGSNSSTPKHFTKFTPHDHTVIPFAIAIKRMSEILIYKANEVTAKLCDASNAVNQEITNLERNATEASNAVNREFQLVSEALELERKKALEGVKRARDEKKRVLEEQLSLISSEKTKVEADIKASQQQIEVRSITKKISDLNCKLDALSMLSEPRENSFIEFRLNNREVSEGLTKLLSTLGSVKTSKTFPSLCLVTLSNPIVHITSLAKVQALDYNGCLQSTGGDPLTASVVDSEGKETPLSILDNADGTYSISFTLHSLGSYCLKVFIFGRPIKDTPLFFDVGEHNDPVLTFGSRGIKEKGFSQPCNAALDSTHGTLYVIDTGNSRIKVLSENLTFLRHIHNDALEGRSVTGICLNERSTWKSLWTINWRSKTVSEISISSGETLSSFTHEELSAPIDLAYWKGEAPEEDRILVADNGLGSVLAFDAASGTLDFRLRPHSSLLKGKLKTQAKNNCQNRFKDLSAVSVAASHGHILIAAGPELLLYDGRGAFLRSFHTPEKGRFLGVVADDRGFLLATRSEKSKSLIQVYDYDKGTLYSSVDSHGSKMKRPTGLAVYPDKHVLAVDLGNDCVKKYRYL
eukprot:TRINITY_DN4012_c0_g1_i1.p1 TRINITY_DN4012_c0_g1~~TRINITY_DN4012_c0_g1_i1.p1  ORF type:complete len:730 (+),score=178.78 TRINITY_DN4012_c0_g1_i1:154-2343(+)